MDKNNHIENLFNQFNKNNNNKLIGINMHNNIIIYIKMI